MWIRTCHGLLINSDCLACIRYDEDSQQTVGVNNSDFLDTAVIAAGNIIPQIITAIRRGDNYMGVDNRGA